MTTTTKDYYNTELIDACTKAKYDTMYYYIEKGADINTVDMKGNTPLQIASQHCSWDVVDELLVQGAAANTVNNYGNTPLHHASDGVDHRDRKRALGFGVEV
jgi:ankyrin repeat protein